MIGTQYIMTLISKCRYLILGIIIFLLMFFSKDIADSIRAGMTLAAFTVIPALFPFFIISDYLSSGNNEILFSKTISKLFSIPQNAACALITGLICGFPAGVKYAVKLYDEKTITKNELERLIGLVNNPSIAFVINAVGVGLLKSLKDGVILFLSLIISILLTANCFFANQQKSNNSIYISEQKFDFAKSIKKSLHSLNLSGIYNLDKNVVLSLAFGQHQQPTLS